MAHRPAWIETLIVAPEVRDDEQLSQLTVHAVRLHVGKALAAQHIAPTAQRVRLPSLNPSTTTISLRLPDAMLEALKILANERDVPYQSLLKEFLADRLAAERGGKRRAS